MVTFYRFPKDPNVNKAVPYGVYDLGQDLGWVNVGTICADAGGSNGHRSRLWKVEVQRFASTAALEVTVCHFPRTSKWNNRAAARAPVSVFRSPA